MAPRISLPAIRVRHAAPINLGRQIRSLSTEADMTAVPSEEAPTEAPTGPKAEKPQKPKKPKKPNNRYNHTISNLLIGKDTRVIFQGFTGRQATANARESIEWGTQIVGGTKPNFTGEHQDLGLPVLPSVREAMEQLKPHATGIYVPASMAAGAIEEAIEAEVPLIVAVAEHIPLHELLRIHSMLKSQTKSRLVGANSPGIISATGKCRIGFQPLASYMPGPVSVAAKSGTLSYEAVTSLTEAGVGQSLCIGIGGDVVSGTDFVDALKAFEQDRDTKAIVLIGEIGGRGEIEAAEWIKDYRKRVKEPKPIAALVAGACAVPGKVMGHAGAWASPGEPSAADKRRALEQVGVQIVNHPSAFGKVMAALLPSQQRTASAAHVVNNVRSYHTLKRPVSLQSGLSCSRQQTRKLHLRHDQALQLLQKSDAKTSDPPLLVMTISRSERSPCLILVPKRDLSRAVELPFDYKVGPTRNHSQSACAILGLKSWKYLDGRIKALWQIFKNREAVSLTFSIEQFGAALTDPRFVFDDAAFTQGKRQQDLHEQRDTSLDDPLTVAGEKYNLVYLPVNIGDGPYVGTLVNGAGLAMNTIDCLQEQGVSVTNFLDTGGKATSETVKESLRLILSDQRVKTVFVNIFGGLTKCDMIAEGVLDAMRELKPDVPIVVRLRGTREKEAETVMAGVEDGMKVYCEPDFDKSVALLKQLVVSEGPTVAEWLAQSSAQTSGDSENIVS